jgi:hypothetical protein
VSRGDEGPLAAEPHRSVAQEDKKMQQGDDPQRLLTEIRDILRAQLEEYRRVTSQSLEFQRRAVLRQERLGRLYKFALIGLALLVAAAVWYLSQLPMGR